jgi:hypothetical protein
MGNVHDLSGFTRESMVVEFTDLATQGHQTPQPIWLEKDKLPAWAKQTKSDWAGFKFSTDGRDAEERREEMVLAMTERKPAGGK